MQFWSLFSPKLTENNSDRPTDQITDPTRPDPTIKIFFFGVPTRPDIQNRWSVPTLDLKPNFEGSWPSRSFYDTFQPVIASPACTIIPREDTDSLLVLGSDGVFDVLSSSETAKYVHHEASIFGKNKEVAWKLVDTSFSRGSSDNITALVVFLNKKEYKVKSKYE